MHKSYLVEQSSKSMAALFVEKHCEKYIVFFLGYRRPCDGGSCFCFLCFEKATGEALPDDDSAYLVIGEKSLLQFGEDDFQDKSNYCGLCLKPLYQIQIDEPCQQRRSSPSWSRRAQQFRNRRACGLRGGGI